MRRRTGDDLDVSLILKRAEGRDEVLAIPLPKMIADAHKAQLPHPGEVGHSLIPGSKKGLLVFDGRLNFHFKVGFQLVSEHGMGHLLGQDGRNAHREFGRKALFHQIGEHI
jgi:hypothetical protein